MHKKRVSIRSSVFVRGDWPYLGVIQEGPRLGSTDNQMSRHVTAHFIDSSCMHACMHGIAYLCIDNEAIVLLYYASKQAIHK